MSHIGECLTANGWRWIRTTEAICSRFTVCPLWPLGNPSIFFLFDGTNRARTYDPLLVRQMLSQLSYDPIQTTQKRLELSTSAVTGRRSNQLSHWAIFCCTYVPSKLHTRNIFFILPITLLGHALDRLVSVSSIHYCTSTSDLSTSSSSRGLTTYVGISHLEGGFTLRCLQRLSRPGFAASHLSSTRSTGSLTPGREPAGGPCQVGSLTGAVASQSVTEARARSAQDGRQPSAERKSASGLDCEADTPSRCESRL